MKVPSNMESKVDEEVMRNGADHPAEMSEEQRKRLEKIKSRNVERLAHDQMNRCHHVSFKIGPLSFYFNPITTIVSAAIIWIFVILCVVYPDGANDFMKDVKTWVTEKWTWLYVVTQDVWAVFIIALYFSKYSNLKLGKDDEKPEFSDGTYFMMLFSAGIAIGLFYYGVAEPVWHYRSVSGSAPFGNRYHDRYSDNQMAQDAINLTYFHWGIHGWIVYVIIGLLLGFLSYRKGLPMTMRTCFYPILGDLIYGIIGDLIDILCIICTMFGVCTSLGLGVMQLNNGIHRINSDIAESTDNQIIIIWCVTALATISVISGLKNGIRRLSEVCFGIGCFIMFFILYSNDTWFILNLFVQSIGYYLQWIIQLGFHTDAFAQEGNAPDGKEAPNWIDGWTIFYWGWWISWSPFVGMFIAKISRGRTIKDFIIYTLTLPSLYSFLWMAIFGGVGIQMQNTAEKAGMNCSLYKTAVQDPSKYNTRWDEVYAMYGTTMLACRGTTEMWFDVMMSHKDLGMMMAVLSLIAIILYFVTSSDSGSLVIDCLSANGNPEPPVMQRIFWALTEGATATALLKAGGSEALSALQTVSVACGLPFTFCLNWTCVAMWRAVREEYGEIDEQEGRWYRSMWSFADFKILSQIPLDIVAPWYRLAKLRLKLDKQESNGGMFILYAIQFGLPFYLWIILMIVEVGVEQISYVAWACLMAFFAFSSGVRGEIREQFDIEGNMIEDLFTMVLVYPLALSQQNDQMMYGQKYKEQQHNGLEMGVNGTYIPNASNAHYPPPPTYPSNGGYVISAPPNGNQKM
ncbi:probable glycine betaine transporter isoform X2 [Clytia hemisphaerica]|uniref:probable glycine betaine transporter isoform X2 n=1 Tax=Clytia hemisphaerica TaxID=252671 RepID=UPI0034D54538